MSIEHVRTGLIVDVETTGLSPKQDEIIELGMILFTYDTLHDEFLEVISEYDFFREPVSTSALMHYDDSYRIHGIPYSMVQGKQFDDKLIKQLVEQADFILAHNASFDRSFLVQMYPEWNQKEWYCSMKHVAWRSYGFINSKLLTLLKGHGISNTQSHRAIDDVKQLHQLVSTESTDYFSYMHLILKNKPLTKYRPKA